MIFNSRFDTMGGDGPIGGARFSDEPEDLSRW
jgi:hypothetical protein